MRGARLLGVGALVAFSLIAASLLVSITLTNDEEITPNDEFFDLSISSPPVIDPSAWRLRVDGLVEHPQNMTYEEVIGLKNRTELAQLRCVTGPSGTAYYTGISLPDFMDMIGLKDGAKELVFYSADNYSTSLTIGQLDRQDVLLAWRMNNVTLPVDQGFPLKLVIPGDWGYKWAKWIVRIEVVDYDYQGYWESRGWADNASIKPISDWRVHAALLSMAAVIGGFAAVSGMRNSRSKEIAARMPNIFPKNFHRYVSALYYCLLIAAFVYWALITYDYRGALFYSFHGRMALITIVFAVVGIVTGLPILAGSDRARTVHFMCNVGGFVLLLITIAMGLALAIG